MLQAVQESSKSIVETRKVRSEESDEQRGSALVLAVFMLVLIGVMGMALMFTSSVETKMSKAGLRTKQVFYLAESGQEDGRATLLERNGAGPFTDDLQYFAGGDDEFQFEPQNLQLSYDADGNLVGVTGFDNDRPLRGITNIANGQYVAFLTNDPDEGWETTEDFNHLVMITGIGTGPNKSVEIVQAIVEKYEILPELPPATLTLLGPLPNFEGGNSNVHDYIGDDCGGHGIPNLSVPVIGMIGATAELHVETQVGPNPGPDYDSGTYSNWDTMVDLTDANEDMLTQAADPMWQDCLAMRDMIEGMRAAATQSCCTAPVCDPEPPCNLLADPPTIDHTTFIDGDWAIGPDGGAGTIVITGHATYDGRASWHGMIFAVGAGHMTRHGGGNGEISGAVVVADIAGPDNIYGTADDCTGGDGGFDSVTYDMDGGGNADTQYCTADIIAAKPKPPYRIVNFRQM